MDRHVARLNIEHYRKLIATEPDETKRQTLIRLQAEEELKLTASLRSYAGENSKAREFGWLLRPSTDEDPKPVRS
jgi:hypothetical protein